MTIASVTESSARRTTTVQLQGQKRPWGPLQYLAALGVVFVGSQIWTYGSWLLDVGVHQITKFRDYGDASWRAARVYEALAILCAIGVLVHIFAMSAERSASTIDAMIVIACAATYWLDPLVVTFQPLFMYSSEWVNVGSWAGQIPGAVNPKQTDCSRSRSCSWASSTQRAYPCSPSSSTW